MDKNYTVFHLHDDTSNCNGFADSCTNYKDYIKLAKENNMKAIAFSNHGGIYDWVKKKQDCDKANIKYIHGVELYLCTKLEANERGAHIGLYAKNLDGVKELNSLISEATSKGILEDKTDRHFYFNPRISLDELMSTSDNIIVTTACLDGALRKWENMSKNALLDEKITSEEKINISKEYMLNRNIFLKWLSKNKHRCFLEIQYHNHIDQIEYNQILYKWSLEYNIPLISGTDTHSSTPYKAECRKILQKSKNSYYGDEDSFDLTWKTYSELIEKFNKQDSLPQEVILEAIENTNVFADMIENFDLDLSFKYPNLYGDNAISLWQENIFNKLKYKLDNNIIDRNKLDKYKKQLQIEFNAMKKQGMESFMLFMSELVDYCIENNIPYSPCRGSVGGSLIAYVTDVTDVDPIVWDTVFSRFCNADRISLADIDMDFAPEDREKVFKFIINKFTNKKTAYIATFSTIKDRGTIDVLTKGLDYENLDEVAVIKDSFQQIFTEYTKIIQEEVNLEELQESGEIETQSIDWIHHDLYASRIRNQSSLTRMKNLKKEFDDLKQSNKDLFYYFDGLEGTIIAKGNHPAGMIGSPITLADNLGVFYKDGDESFPVSFCSMKAVDSLNYVKFDILGLKTIGIIKNTYKYINSKVLRSHEVNWNDDNVWENMIKYATGIFQFEEDYAFSLLKDFQPRAINDMSLVNAALRPSGKSYRDRLIKKEINKNPSELIDKLLEKNYGYLTFQEDTIKFLTDICGFDGSTADTTRKAIGKKDIDLLNKQLPKILEGYCKISDKPREIAEQEAKQFLKIIDDSSEYQFGYNHSTGYSMNGYVCAMLRTYYPLEFVTAYLNIRGNKMDFAIKGQKLAEFLGIKVHPITYGKSIAEYTFDKKENVIYKGISSIKFCNEQIATELYELAQIKQHDNFVDLLADIKQTSIDSRQLNILITLNFFSKYGKNKRLLEINELYDNLANRKQLNAKNIEEFNIDEEMLLKYCGKQTAKLYKELDIIGYIREVIKKIEDKSLTIGEQVKKEFEFLEYTSYINDKAPKDFYIVVEFKTFKDKSKPYLILRNIKTGEETKTKVKDSKTFSQVPFKLFDVIKVKKFTTQKKTKCINGKWEKSDENEEILTSWECY